MKNKVKLLKTVTTLNRLFINNLVKGNYSIQKIDKYTISINIYGFLFEFWMTSGSDYFDFYDSIDKLTFLHLKFTKNNKIKIWKKIYEKLGFSTQKEWSAQYEKSEYFKV